ncbi:MULTISPECIES: 50S ribosomal protein L21 [Caldisericum]|jgi:large subunit ribosomal protein L21|uniref:Large ribosomal subunit protein bL21 n=1 Tax=Caldisericum exile TaxID=693075 RepID=A0A2J6WFA6_9BACT|nr:MAG: 50S ribosomal protein L21 [Caldisericum exile]PMP82076.1 MAG: 50S ribosomal protein L21 [Caldisericum exile]HEM55360.1 50S ribosomal protein L21 [Thermodesulfobium narugense]
MEAIIKTGGHQYRVKEGDTIKVQKIEGEIGTKVKFDEVLLLKDGEKVVVGNPKVQNAYVEGTIKEQGREKKIIVFFYRHKTRNKKKQGHRQPYTLITIDKIVGEVN